MITIKQTICVNKIDFIYSRSPILRFFKTNLRAYNNSTNSLCNVIVLDALSDSYLFILFIITPDGSQTHSYTNSNVHSYTKIKNIRHRNNMTGSSYLDMSK